MSTDKDAEDIVRSAMSIAAEICIYTNNNLTLEKISPKKKTEEDSL
jgi:ATP-dependent HslUV protease subunit HslV